MNGFNSWIDTLEILSSEAVPYAYIFCSREEEHCSREEDNYIREPNTQYFFTPIYIGVLTPNMSGSIITNQKTQKHKNTKPNRKSGTTGTRKQK